jgi:hypothetical protein
MKTIIKFLFLSFLLVILGCEKLDYNNSDVQEYVNQLKNGSPEAYNIPEFTASDISALLLYRNDTTDIYSFPSNPISSYAMTKCKLGMVILWTIESIRVCQNGNNPYIGRCPSQNPILALRDDPSVWFFDTKSQFEAADAYYDWWMSISLFTDKMKKNPLAKTKYIWH